jgi:hypothetical protein
MLNRPRHRTALRTGATLLAMMLTLGVPSVRAAGPADVLRADLDGSPIALSEVGRLHCQDIEHPRIHCFTSDALAAQSVQAEAIDGVGYVVIYEDASFRGASMYVSQDYPVLAVVGWNDRISSFKAINGESGRFHVNWFYGGSSWSFCCNQQVSSLGSYDDTFSSLERT